MPRLSLGLSSVLSLRTSVFWRTFSTQRKLIDIKDVDGIRIMKMNNPKRLNAWTQPMMKELAEGTKAAAKDANVKGLVLTGTGRFYCAGVDLGSIIRPMMPKKLFETIKSSNENLFNLFLDFPKPMVIAINGNAVGASVTSATLADSIVALDGVTFSTPFHALGICPEGCSSVNFERLMGKESAQRMLGQEGWKPSANEWKKLGVVEEVVQRSAKTGNTEEEIATIQAEDEAKLVDKAVEVAKRWVLKGKRNNKEVVSELKQVNSRESFELANCFLSEPFLKAQYEFAKSKGKTDVARLFYTAKLTRPLWSKFL